MKRRDENEEQNPPDFIIFFLCSASPFSFRSSFTDPTEKNDEQERLIKQWNIRI